MENYRPEPVVFGLDSPPQHLEPPKSRRHYQTDYKGIGFQKQGEDTMMEAILFFYGAVVSFGLAAYIAYMLNENENRDGAGAIFFVIIFALLGLYSVYMMVSKYLESLRTTSWMFARGEAECRSVRFGSTRSKTYDLYGWKSLVVQIPEAEYEKHHTVELELKLECDADKLSAYYNDATLWQRAGNGGGTGRFFGLESEGRFEFLPAVFCPFDDVAHVDLSCG
jgi:hypothetical protein